MTEHIILVNAQDNEVGIGEKMQVHQEGKLHRAFSVFVINNKNEILLQQRAKGKYHSPGLWTNTCCSHPHPGETVLQAAHRRLKEEMGFDCELRETFVFPYRAEFDNGLIENEIDHVVFGIYDGVVNPNSEEVSDHRWVSGETLQQELSAHPEQYTAWLKICIGKVVEEMGEWME